MNQLAITKTSADNLPVTGPLRTGLGQELPQLLAKLEDGLMRYAKTRSFTLCVIGANLLLLLIAALSPTRTVGDERFWRLE